LCGYLIENISKINKSNMITNIFLETINIIIMLYIVVTPLSNFLGFYSVAIYGRLDFS
jgi:hypothetical protein